MKKNSEILSPRLQKKNGPACGSFPGNPNRNPSIEFKGTGHRPDSHSRQHLSQRYFFSLAASAARQRYQAAMLRKGRQRSPWASNAEGRGISRFR